MALCVLMGVTRDVCLSSSSRLGSRSSARVKARVVHHGDCPTRPGQKITYSDGAFLVLPTRRRVATSFGDAKPLILTMLHQGYELGIPLVPELAIFDFDQLLLSTSVTDIG